MEGDGIGEAIPNLHTEWIRKRRDAKVRRRVDDMLTARIQSVVNDRVARLRVAADNLDQQRAMIENLYQNLNGA